MAAKKKKKSRTLRDKEVFIKSEISRHTLWMRRILITPAAAPSNLFSCLCPLIFYILCLVILGYIVLFFLFFILHLFAHYLTGICILPHCFSLSLSLFTGLLSIYFHCSLFSPSHCLIWIPSASLRLHTSRCPRTKNS